MNKDLESAIDSLRQELTRIQAQCSDALCALDEGKTSRLVQFQVPDVRAQRLIQEILILKGTELEDLT